MEKGVDRGRRFFFCLAEGGFFPSSSSSSSQWPFKKKDQRKGSLGSRVDWKGEEIRAPSPLFLLLILLSFLFCLCTRLSMNFNCCLLGRKQENILNI